MKKTYSVEVDCPNCAAKIEAAVNKIDGVDRATVNFLTQKMTVEAGDPDALLGQIVKAGKRVDGDFAIVK